MKGDEDQSVPQKCSNGQNDVNHYQTNQLLMLTFSELCRTKIRILESCLISFTGKVCARHFTATGLGW